MYLLWVYLIEVVFFVFILLTYDHRILSTGAFTCVSASGVIQQLMRQIKSAQACTGALFGSIRHHERQSGSICVRVAKLLVSLQCVSTRHELRNLEWKSRLPTDLNKQRQTKQGVKYKIKDQRITGFPYLWEHTNVNKFSSGVEIKSAPAGGGGRYSWAGGKWTGGRTGA